eukprot:UN23386
MVARYQIRPGILLPYIPIKAKAEWHITPKTAKLIIHMKMNPQTKISLKQLKYEIDFSQYYKII